MGLETFSNGAIFVIYDYFPVLFVERASFKSSDRDGGDKGHFFFPSPSMLLSLLLKEAMVSKTTTEYQTASNKNHVYGRYI